METSLLSISKIFTERIFRIPDYQRGYAWTKKQLKDFWNDLLQLEDGKNHYVGVLTLENVPKENMLRWEDDLWIIESKSYWPYYIVDGQQRLTTSIILIQAICEITPKDKTLNFTSLTEIQKKFIFDSKDNGISRSYIFGYEKDNPSYEFLKTKIFLEESTHSETQQETAYTNNLEYAKLLFIDQLKELEFKKIEEIYKKLTQNFLFNIYTISNDIDVFIAFETMNNRGKPLSHLELLKNRLIYLSTKLLVDNYEKEQLRKRINECWKSVYHNLGKNKNNPLEDDKFLQNHFFIYFGSDFIEIEENGSKIHRYFTTRRFNHYLNFKYSEYLLESIFTVKNINKDQKYKLSIQFIDDYVRDLKRSVEVWFKINNPSESGYSELEIELLMKILRTSNEAFSALILVFFCKEKNKTKRIEFLQLIEKLLFFNLLSNQRYYISEYYDHKWLDAIDLYNDKINSESVIKKIESTVKELNSKKEFWKEVRQGFKINGFYKWQGIKYFLYEYEMFLRSQSKTKSLKIDWLQFVNEQSDYKTVEHIYPQNPRKECWINSFKLYSSKERSILRHSLGNLLPLSKPKNSSFSNNCFIEKIGSENNTVGYRYGSFSEIKVSTYSSWTANDILDRGLELLEFMENNWKLNLGTRADKIKFLNLEFVKERKREPINLIIKK